MITELPLECKGFQVHCYYFSISTDNMFLPLNESLSSAVCFDLPYRKWYSLLIWIVEQSIFKAIKFYAAAGGYTVPGTHKLWFYFWLFIAKSYINLKFLCTKWRQIVGAAVGLQSCQPDWWASRYSRVTHEERKPLSTELLNSYISFLFWHKSPDWARASSFTRLIDHTQRRTTFGRTPMDECSARRRDLRLPKYNTHNRQTSIPPVGFEPSISAGERPQTCALDRAATGTANSYIININKI
jgi:hypothetical protein